MDQLRLFEAKCALGRFYIYCESEERALRMFRYKFTVLEVEIKEVTEITWIASAETIAKLVGIPLED